MRTLFNLHSPAETGVVKPPSWNYVRQGLQENLLTIVRFHRRNPTAVKSSHFLVRLIGAIAIPHSLTLERYFANVDSLSLNTSMALKMTSSIAKGAVFKGIFYGERCHEILIADDCPFDIVAANKNWQNLSPVTVLRHPRSDLAMNLPDGRDTGSEYGLAVIKIHVAMLAVMYRAFSQNEMRMKGHSEPHLTVTQFIRMYVLPNMLPSHLDQAIFNRMDNMTKGAPMGESTRKHSFALIDYTRRVDVILGDVLENIEKKRQGFAGVMRSMPAIISQDMFDVMELPNMAPTRQVMWALVVARIPLISFLFRVGRDKVNTANQSDINQIRRAITSYQADRLLESVLPIEDYYAAQFALNDIMDKSKT